DRADLLRLRALGALGDGVLDTLVVLEAAVAVSLDGGMVDEDVRRAVVRGDEPVALVRVEPLHCSLSHCALLAKAIIGMHGRAFRAAATACPSEAGPGSDGARGQNFAGAMTRTRISTTTSFIEHHPAARQRCNGVLSVAEGRHDSHRSPAPRAEHQHR